MVTHDHRHRQAVVKSTEEKIGIGDEVMATGLARGAAARGKRIAFGDGRRLIWGPWCEQAFRYNPNIAHAIDDRAEWVGYYKGNRLYNRAGDLRWFWNYEFKAAPGEFYFNELEQAFIVRRAGVLIEPNVPWHKSVAANKDWGIARYQLLADRLRVAGIRVFQFSHGKLRLAGAEVVPVSTFRQAAAVLAGFELAIVPEGGLHHAAAAVGTRAIVIFGGFIPPDVTGYTAHVNLTGLMEGESACGSWRACPHCRKALNQISVEEVHGHAVELCEQGAAKSAGIGRIPAVRAR